MRLLSRSNRRISSTIYDASGKERGRVDAVKEISETCFGTFLRIRGERI